MKKIRLKAVGDIMLGDHPVCFGHGVRSMIEQKGIDYIFEKIKSHVKDTDIFFGNLETVLSDFGYEQNNIIKGEMRGNPCYVEGLAAVGFTVLSLANNHAMQHGVEAFNETVSVLNKNNIFCVGLNINNNTNKYVYTNNGISIALISVSLRQENYSKKEILYSKMDVNQLVNCVKLLKQEVDNVIVSLHWGDEFITYPSYEQINIAHEIVNAGASLILGHHPHVLQGIEKYENSYIVYSLGNFVFDQWQKNTKETIILDVLFNKDGIEELTYIPTYINNYYQPNVCSGDIKNEINNKMLLYTNKINDIIHRKEKREEYEKEAKKIYNIFRIECYLYFIKNIRKYSFTIILQTMRRFILRRLEYSK